MLVLTAVDVVASSACAVGRLQLNLSIAGIIVPVPKDSPWPQKLAERGFTTEVRRSRSRGRLSWRGSSGGLGDGPDAACVRCRPSRGGFDEAVGAQKQAERLSLARRVLSLEG